MWICDLVFGQQNRAHWGKCVLSFTHNPLTRSPAIPGTDVVDDGIAKHMIHGVFFPHILRCFSDDHRQFHFMVKLLREGCVVDDVCIRSSDSGGGLGKNDGFLWKFVRCIQRSGRFSHVFGEVQSDPDDVFPRFGNRGQHRQTVFGHMAGIGLLGCEGLQHPVDFRHSRFAHVDQLQHGGRYRIRKQFAQRFGIEDLVLILNAQPRTGSGGFIGN